MTPPLRPSHTIANPDAQLPSGDTNDLTYVLDTYVALAAEHERYVQEGTLPKATYVLPDGTAMVPPDHAQLLAEANDPHAVKALFLSRFIEASGPANEAEEAHEDWLSGEYGACLWQTSPESIVLKGALMQAVTALIAHPEPGQPRWERALRCAVNALDVVVRPFADHDRSRWKGPLSRDRLVTGVKVRYPSLWAGQES
jgi:hypothetical protein